MMRILFLNPDVGDGDDDDETKPLYPFVPISTDPFTTTMGKTDEDDVNHIA